jgi:hypothetical protein
MKTVRELPITRFQSSLRSLGFRYVPGTRYEVSTRFSSVTGYSPREGGEGIAWLVGGSRVE